MRHPRLDLFGGIVAGVTIVSLASGSSADTLRVPSEYATINAAMDVVVFGDSVLVAPGIYDDYETRTVVVAHTSSAFVRDGVTLLSEAGPDQTVLRVDGPGSSATESVIHVGGLPSSETVIEGFEITGTMPGLTGIWGEDSGKITVRNCRFVDLDTGRLIGGGIWVKDLNLDLYECEVVRCVTSSSGGGIELINARLHAFSCYFEACDDEAIRVDGFGPTGGETWIADTVFKDNLGTAIGMRNTRATIVRCTFLDNTDSIESGAIVASASIGEKVNLRGCLFAGNVGGPSGGGAILWTGARGAIAWNTFVGNEGPSGSAVFLSSDELLFFTNNVLSGNVGSPAVLGAQPQPNSGCNVFWNNPDGNAEGYVIQPTSILADPQFCNPATGNYTVRSTSPCLPENSAGCGEIGAFGEGCGGVHTEPVSWGRIKSSFR